MLVQRMIIIHSERQKRRTTRDSRIAETRQARNARRLRLIDDDTDKRR